MCWTCGGWPKQQANRLGTSANCVMLSAWSIGIMKPVTRIGAAGEGLHVLRDVAAVVGVVLEVAEVLDLQFDDLARAWAWGAACAGRSGAAGAAVAVGDVLVADADLLQDRPEPRRACPCCATASSSSSGSATAVVAAVELLVGALLERRLVGRVASTARR